MAVSKTIRVPKAVMPTSMNKQDLTKRDEKKDGENTYVQTYDKKTIFHLYVFVSPGFRALTRVYIYTRVSLSLSLYTYIYTHI